MIFYDLDPPYKGQSKKHYGNHPDYNGEVDHREMLAKANSEADGWCLHLSSPSLPSIIRDLDAVGIDESEYRIMAWVKPFAAFKPNVSVAYAWEPVIVKPVRKPVVTGRVVMRDWLSENITMQRGVSGAKPDRLNQWVFEVAGLQPDDTFVDVFPGSGAIQRSWDAWCEAVLANPSDPLDDRTSKLPVWARNHIAELEGRLASLTSDET